MLQRLTLLCALLLSFAVPAFSQDEEKATSVIEKPSRDNVMLQFTYNGWAKQPDSLKTGGFGRGFNAYICYDFPIKKTSLSFAAGLGISTANIYFHDQEMVLTDTGAAASAVKFRTNTKDYKVYKLTTAYLTAPFELRYVGNKKNWNKGFKAAIGVTVGALVGAHVKDKISVDGTKVVEKVDTKRYLDSWSFAGTARLGYGNFSVFGSYNVTALFKESQGPPVIPFALGIAITGL